MNRKRWLALIAVAMLVVASVTINLGTRSQGDEAGSLMGFGLGGGENWNETVVEQGSELTGTIAIIEINGVIQDGGAGGIFSAGYDHRQILAQLDHAGRDSNTEGISYFI